MVCKIHAARSVSHPPQGNPALLPRGCCRRGVVSERVVRIAEGIQRAFFFPGASAGIEFRSHHCGKNGAPKDLAIFDEPVVFLASKVADIDSGIEEKWAGRELAHALRARVRRKTSSGPPRRFNIRRACKPASTARRSSTASLIASELLRERRILRSLRILSVSSKTFVLVSATPPLFRRVCNLPPYYTHSTLVVSSASV